MESCPILKAGGRILREDIRADRDQPAFNKALMDGIAISYAQWRKGLRAFPIERVIAAGKPTVVLKNRLACVQIMTGATVPKGCNCIIPIEDIRMDGHIAHMRDGAKCEAGQFIRPQGADAKKNVIVLRKGIRLLAPHIGVAASVGKTHLKVSARPLIAVIATGDELVDVGVPIKTHQTRLSNSYALQNLFKQNRLARPEMVLLPDNKSIMLAQIRRMLKQYDILVLSGGVSAGKFDYVPQVLAELGVKVLLHKVAQKPGKPFWFGMTKDQKPVFALPGNPVSTLVCAYRYVLPYLTHRAGLKCTPPKIAVQNVPKQTSNLVQFLPVKDGRVISSGGSGDFAAVARADGFIEYDSTIKHPLRPYFSWRP